jgi:glycosyltransferase involved in cell wall biosynthesis
MKKQNILFFTSFNARSIQIESIVMYFKNNNYNVFFFTTCETGSIHKELAENGVLVSDMKISKTIGIFYYFRMICFLISFSNKNNIDFIHSHLQIPNLVSSIARFFIKATVFNVRHNSDVIEISGSYKEKIIEKIINRLSSHIIAISDKVRNQLIEKENVNPSKIYRINNGYNFSDYEALSISSEECQNIKKNYKSKLLIVSPGRLIKTKRHDIAIKGISELILKGYEIQLLILGDGPEQKNIEKLISQLNLQKKIHLLGYQENISDFLMASDIVLMLSESEASSNTIKEAGYFKKPVIVCENVGDFSDYVVNDVNGYVISKENPLPEFVKLIENFYNNKEPTISMGENLQKTILKEFDIQLIGRKFEELQKETYK